jgi:hypothetical protein
LRSYGFVLRRGALAAVLLVGLANVVVADEQVVKWQPSIDIVASPGTDRNFGQTDLFAPIWQDDRRLLFLDLRGLGDDHDAREGNFGTGFRLMTDAGWNLGGYGFFDIRRTPLGNTFYQTTAGIEALREDWDVRVNYYQPLTEARPAPGASAAEISGGTILFRAGQERALAGFDAELGLRLPLLPAGADTQVRVYGGAFSFRSGNEHVAGPRARLELDIYDIDQLGLGSRLTLEASLRSDAVRRTQEAGLLRLRIPLGGLFTHNSRKLDPLERRMVDPIVRDVDVVTAVAASGPAETALVAANGVTIQKLATADATTTNLAGAVGAAGANSVVVIDCGKGLVNLGSSTVSPQANQTLLGGGSQLLVRGAVSGLTANFTAPGSRPTLVHDTTFGAMNVANNNVTLSGFNVSGGFNGISAGGAANLRINDVNLTNSGTTGLFVSNFQGLTVNGLTVSNNLSFDGIFLSNSQNTTLANITLSNINRIGFFIGTGNVGTTLNNVTVMKTGATGIFLNTNQGTAISNTTLVNTGGIGIHLTGNTGVTLSNVSIVGSGQDGILLAGGQNTSFANVVVNGPNQGGFAGSAAVRLTGSVDASAGAVTAGGLPAGTPACDATAAAVTRSTLLVNSTSCP